MLEDLENKKVKHLVQAHCIKRVIVCCFFLSLLLFALFVDYLPVPFGGFSDQRMFLCLILALVVTVCLWSILSFPEAKLTLIGYWRVWALVLVAMLGVFPRWDQPHVWVEPVFFSLYFLAFFLGGQELKRHFQRTEFLAYLITVTAGACFLYGAMTFNVYLFALADGVSDLSDYIPWGVVNVRYWSHLATWFLPLLPLAILIGPLSERKLWRAAVAIAAALWWWVAFLSTARGTMLSVLLGCLFATLVFGRAAVPWLKISVRYLLYGVLAWFVLSVLVPPMFVDSVQMRALSVSGSGRLRLFLEAWQMSLQNFPFGMGAQSWLTHELLTDEYAASKKLGHPHNMYLMWAAEYGWIFIGVLLLFVAQVLKLLSARAKEIQRGQMPYLSLPAVAFTASVTASLVHAGFSAVYLAPASMLAGLSILMVFWALIQPPRLTEGRVTQCKRQQAFAGFISALLLLGCAAWLNQVWIYHQAMSEDMAFYGDNVAEGTLPRFWFHGNFPRNPSQMP